MKMEIMTKNETFWRSPLTLTQAAARHTKLKRLWAVLIEEAFVCHCLDMSRRFNEPFVRCQGQCLGRVTAMEALQSASTEPSPRSWLVSVPCMAGRNLNV